MHSFGRARVTCGPHHRWTAAASPKLYCATPFSGAWPQNFPLIERKVSFSVVSRRRATSMRTMLHSTS